MTTAHDPDRRFGGVRRLFGDAACSAFRRAHVGVIGVGGVGSWAAEALARSAIGRVTLFDMDHIAESNVNRQLHALDGAFGRAKVIAMAERLRAINPECGVTAVEDFVTAENLEDMLERDFDWVIDCADNFRVKAAIIAHCKRRKIRIITVGAAGGLDDPLGVKIADLSRTVQDPLLARTRRQLRARHGFTRNLKRRFDIPCVCSEAQPAYYAPDGGVTRRKPSRRGASSPALGCAGGMGSAMTVTATFGLVAVSHVLKRLAAAPGETAVPRQEGACA
ncbi:MAG: tRNA threonylcarbamoyladenosine dehydratase [Gammaproteobacteria bacterium]|nr:tRNA threonylcarbamoyladenosine dehydratase [Gammaproteobacteria bacterium]MCG3144335.1 tRNA threonylcarbamoyladenosine dehydratase [Gammaproteobacteria bacterium]